MNDIVNEWIEKAESDYHVAERELRVRKNPSYDAICFHAQQCAEKYLKAFLAKHRTIFRPIHDLEVLLDHITPAHPDFEFTRDLLLLLNDYAVDFRYPGATATQEEARAAIKAMRTVREFVRQKLGLATPAKKGEL
ncbi:MAG: HEPN domain-containing protein [Chloroflexi bacterium]|nr:HEPN domain-containing protein [Chloroflexota bacterium]